MSDLTTAQFVDQDKRVIVDLEQIQYDVDKYPFIGWMKNKIAERGFDSSDLTQLHETVPYTEVSALTKWMINETGGNEWREIAHSFTHDILEPLFGSEIAVQRFMNIRILLPQRTEMIINFHTGLWYGHGMGTGTCWIPMTPVFGTNSMQVIGREQSVALCKQAYDETWRQDKMQDVFFKASRPVVAEPGEAVLFNQEIIHGNVPNETGQSRVSCDFRLTVRDGKVRRKLVGGYYELLDKHIRDGSHSGNGESKVKAAKTDAAATKESEDYKCISYVNNNTRITSGIPIVLQRLMMRDYCEPKGLKYTYEQLELEVMGHLPTLQQIIEVDQPDEIVLYSVYSLPENPELRKSIIDLALQYNVKLHFANEDYQFETEEDREWIDDVLGFGEVEVIRHEA